MKRIPKAANHLLWTSTGEPVQVFEVYPNGLAARIGTASGAHFTVTADELEPEGWEPDALERLLMARPPRKHIHTAYHRGDE